MLLGRSGRLVLDQAMVRGPAGGIVCLANNAQRGHNRHGIFTANALRVALEVARAIRVRAQEPGAPAVVSSVRHNYAATRQPNRAPESRP